LAGENLVVGLDIGTTKTVAVVGEVNDYGGVSIIGVGEQATLGVRKGNIVDLEGVTKSISLAVEKAEQMSGYHLQNSYISVSGAHLSSINNKGIVAITNRDKEVSTEDVHRVIQAAKVVALPPDRKIIHIHPRQYTVDGNESIIDPIGMAGTRMEAEINIVTASATTIQNLLKCIHKAGIEEEELVPAPLASAEAVLFPAERDLGCLIIDIGGGTTEFAVFDQGRLWYASVLPVGGNLITSDIAIGLRTTVEVAEDLKTQYGCALSGFMPENEAISIPDMLGKEQKYISKKMLSSIIEPRAQEIIALVKNELKKSGYQGVLPGGMIITGGGAQLDGLVELASDVMNLPARVGQPNNLGGVNDALQKPAFATAAGLVLFGGKRISSAQAASSKERFFGGFLSHVKHLFQDFFS